MAHRLLNSLHDFHEGWSKEFKQMFRVRRRTQMKFSKTLALAGLLTGALILSSPLAPARADDDDDHKGRRHGKSKHHYCYDKHGRWRSHPHCPPPQHHHHGDKRYHHSHYHHHHGDGRYYHSHSHDHYRAGYHRHSQPKIIYVRKDGPFDHRARVNTPVITRDHAKAVRDARKEVQQSSTQLRKDHAELKSDRAELRRDILKGASKDEIRKDRQEIRADLAKIKPTKQDLRNDRADLDMARREWRNDLRR
jgi:hypothetical protein